MKHYFLFYAHILQPITMYGVIITLFSLLLINFKIFQLYYLYNIQALHV